MASVDDSPPAKTFDPSKPIHGDHADGWHGVVAPGTFFAPESGRYHLYIGLFCPFAHRVNIVRHLKGLASAIPISIVKPYPKGKDGWPGWCFPETEAEYEGATLDALFGSKYMHEVYFRADGDYKGRYSVPALWDTKRGTMVNNESAEMLRWLQTGFDELVADESKKGYILYPENLRKEIDEIKAWVMPHLNSGVYKAGFATDQQTYDKNVVVPFAALNELEKIAHAHGGPYILGKQLTELDVLVYATAIRFDVVYVQHFKCNLGTIRDDYPVLHEWLKNLYHNVHGFKESTNFRHIKENYTKSHTTVNPLAITPKGPFPDIRSGVVTDFSTLKPGSVDHPEVLERQKEFFGKH